MLQVHDYFPCGWTRVELPVLVGFPPLDPAIMYDKRWFTGFADCYATGDGIGFVIERSRVHYVKLLSSVTTVYGKFFRIFSVPQPPSIVFCEKVTTYF